MSTIEELLERKNSGSGLGSWEYGHRDPSRWPRGTLNPQKLALTSQTSGSRWVGIVRSRTQATEFVFLYGNVNVPKKWYPVCVPVQQVFDRSVEIWFVSEELHRLSDDKANVICEIFIRKC
jgi:hypothetical protein